MGVPAGKKEKETKKHFLQNHPTIGRFFETFGCFAYVIIIVVIVSIVMNIHEPWRPIWLKTVKQIIDTWCTFWGKTLPTWLKWEWWNNN